MKPSPQTITVQGILEAVWEVFFLIQAHKTPPITITSADRGLPRCPTHIPWVWIDAYLTAVTWCEVCVCVSLCLVDRLTTVTCLVAVRTTRRTRLRPSPTTTTIGGGFLSLSYCRKDSLSSSCAGTGKCRRLLLLLWLWLWCVLLLVLDMIGTGEMKQRQQQQWQCCCFAFTERKNCCGAHKTLWGGKKATAVGGEGRAQAALSPSLSVDLFVAVSLYCLWFLLCFAFIRFFHLQIDFNLLLLLLLYFSLIIYCSCFRFNLCA